MLKFDTRNKKPNLYSVLVLSIAVAALEAVLLCGKLQSGILISCAVLDFYFAAVLVLLARAFFGQIQYNPYSYNTIYYAGFFLFLLLFPDGLQFFFYLFCGEVDASNGSAVVHQNVTWEGGDVETTEEVEVPRTEVAGLIPFQTVGCHSIEPLATVAVEGDAKHGETISFFAILLLFRLVEGA